MDNKGKDATEGSSSTRAPKRVAGGIIVKAKKKKKTKCTSTQKVSESSKVGASSTSIPSILSNIPTHHEQDNCNSNQPTAALKSDEFDDTAEFDDNDVPSDALLCFQTLTQFSTFGGMSETCAYCPIYTHNGDDKDGSNSSRSTTAVPFLPRHILLYMLNKSSTTLNTNTRTHIEQEIKQLAVSNKVRLLQLHGTAMISNNTCRSGFRGDGNDDEDVAIMEFSAYNVASKMAIEKYFQAQQSTTALQQQHISKVDMVHSWFTRILLPYFAGRCWFSSGALNDFYNNVNHLHSLKQMEEMIQQLVHAGVLMPRRGVNPSTGGGGYWFSLPGLGKAAKSIVDGRTNLLRRLQFSLHKEKKRSTLEFEIGRIKSSSTTNKNKLEQAGKFVVLEMLAKGLVDVHKTCTGEQLIRLVE